MYNNPTESELTLFTAYKISSAETDMFTRIRAGALVNLLIQSAIGSAENLGFGFKGLKEQQLFWVLSRLTLEIFHPLAWHEEAEVETWPKTVEGLLYIRDFIVRNKEKQIIAKATSGWLAIDTQKKRPKNIDGIQAEMFVHLKGKCALGEAPEKLPPTTEGEVFTINSSYFDFDLNRHVTSTRYIDWMMDTFTIDFHKKHFPKKISVNFMKETLPGDSIVINRNKAADSQFSFEGFNMQHNTVAFRGKIEF